MFRNAIDRLKETHLATRLDRWMTGAIVVLLVALGFVGGRWTSLTNATMPIVFQEAPDGSSVASPEDLRALVAGTETKASPSPKPAAPAPTPRAAAKSRPASEGAYVASANGTKYYHPDCAEVRRIKEENKIWFDSAEEAKDSGYEPSVCVQKRGGKE